MIMALLLLIRVSRLWAQSYMGTIVWTQSCMGPNVSGHKRVDTIMQGHNRVVSRPNESYFGYISSK